MNSSPSLMPNAPPPQPAVVLPQTSPFPYFPVASTASTSSPTQEMFPPASGLDATAEAAAQQELRRTSERAAAVEQGRIEARRTFDDQVARERAAMAEALAHFSRERATYFEKVEGEVVQLALSIAAKVIHRESQLDPLLLAAVVRVALERIERGTGVVLRVHPQKVTEWRTYFVAHMRPEDIPEVVEDSGQSPNQCTLQTSMGTAIVGMEVQLKEIEQGLMDLLATRPGAAR